MGEAKRELLVVSRQQQSPQIAIGVDGKQLIKCRPSSTWAAGCTRAEM